MTIRNTIATGALAALFGFAAFGGAAFANDAGVDDQVNLPAAVVEQAAQAVLADSDVIEIEIIEVQDDAVEVAGEQQLDGFDIE